MSNEFWHLSAVLAFCSIHIFILSFVVLRVSSVFRRGVANASPQDRSTFRASPSIAWGLELVPCVLSLYYLVRAPAISAIWFLAVGLGGLSSTSVSALSRAFNPLDVDSPETFHADSRTDAQA